jgi:predicted transcriptional regulator
MKTLAEIAFALGIPPTTIRYHASYYSEFLPSIKVEGQRWPLYEDMALEVLRFITKNIKEGKQRQEIKKELREMYPETIELTGTKDEQRRQKDNYITTTRPTTGLMPIAFFNELEEHNKRLLEVIEQMSEVLRKNTTILEELTQENKTEAKPHKQTKKHTTRPRVRPQKRPVTPPTNVTPVKKKNWIERLLIG